VATVLQLWQFSRYALYKILFCLTLAAPPYSIITFGNVRRTLVSAKLPVWPDKPKEDVPNCFTTRAAFFKPL
jgi:hypothetical protein